METYTRDNVTFSYRDDGVQKPRGVLVVLSGWGFGSLMGEAAFGDWRDDGWRVITVDLPGIGHLNEKSSFVHIQRIARVLAAFLRDVGGHESIVIGHAFGSMVAQEMAISEDDVVQKLVLISALPGIGGLVPDLHTSMDMLNRLMMGERGLLSHLFTPGNLAQLKKQLGPHFTALDTPVPCASLSGQVWAASRWTNMGRLGHIYQPVLLLQGDGDPLCPVHNARTLAAQLDDATLHVMHCGYLPFLEKKEETRTLLEAFMR